jgi:hypothetical protein
MGEMNTPPVEPPPGVGGMGWSLILLLLLEGGRRSPSSSLVVMDIGKEVGVGVGIGIGIVRRTEGIGIGIGGIEMIGMIEIEIGTDGIEIGIEIGIVDRTEIEIERERDIETLQLASCWKCT